MRKTLLPSLAIVALTVALLGCELPSSDDEAVGTMLDLTDATIVPESGTERLSGQTVPASAPYGAAAALADTDLTMMDMLTYAIQGEYLARGEYAAIMARFRVSQPFSTIRSAEESHILAARKVMAAHSLAAPADASSGYIVVPATLKAAFEAGVEAEQDNIAMYNLFLAQPAVSQPSNLALRNLFLNLKSASTNHLKVFTTQLSRN